MNEFIFDDLSLGLKSQFDVKITVEMMNRFFHISGDSNPLHLYDEYAREHGFKDRVVYGLLTSSFYSRLVGVYLPGKYALLQGIKTSFDNPVYIGNQLTVTGEITYLNNAYKVIEIKGRIKNEHDIIVSKAKINVSLLK
jgi:3-hydroxybutyryl-CoA dehydratase